MDAFAVILKRSDQPVVVVLEHVGWQSLGTLEPILARECRLRTLSADNGVLSVRRDVGELLSTGAYDALIVLGGPMSVLDAAEDEILQESLRMLRAAKKADVPVLGIGLGAQLLAWVLGARVWKGRTRGRHTELGWYRISLSGRGRVDPALHGFRELEPVFLWHEDSFDVPEGAWPLARSEQYELQAFRHGHRRYGLQFHVEATAQMVAEWVERYPEALTTLKRADADEIVRRAARYCERMEEKALYLGEQFLRLIEDSRSEKLEAADRGRADETDDTREAGEREEMRDTDVAGDT